MTAENSNTIEARIGTKEKPHTLFSEITQLVVGEIPRGAVPVSTGQVTTDGAYWMEAARYVIYEEVFDESQRQFSTPQYPSLPYSIFEWLCRVFKKELKMFTSGVLSASDLMKSIADSIAEEGALQEESHSRSLLNYLNAKRWHPQINYRIGIFKVPHDSVSEDGRRLSFAVRSDEALEMVNKYLSACLAKGSEACNIMIGCLPFLTKAVYRFVKLSNDASVQMNGLVEVDAPLRFVFVALTPYEAEVKDLYQLGRCFASLLNDKGFRDDLYKAREPRALYEAAINYRRNVASLSCNLADLLNSYGGIDVAASHFHEINFERTDLVFDDYNNEQEQDKLPEPTQCSCSAFTRLCPPFKELIKGVKVLASRLPSDFRDAFTKDNFGTMLSSILFIYFVVFGPAITFGTLMKNEVNANYTVSLNIFAAGSLTIIYSLLAGQPLASVGPSGPGFILETVIAMFATMISADYQIFRFWIGIYMSAFGLILIAMNLSPMVTYARRSLEELFSSFISIFLISKSIFSMFKLIPQKYPSPDPNTATADELKTALQQTQRASVASANLFMAFCMLVFCMLINKLKRSHFFRRTFRYWLGALNVPLGIIFVSLMNYIFFSSYNVNMLDIPPATQFDPKNWVFMVDLSKVASFTSPDPGTLHGLAIFVGFCFALLVFTETALNSVTALKPKARKPSPFVMDHVLTVVIFPLISCILGWPFMSGVPVRTIATTMALVRVDPHPPPGMPAAIICLVEQRVSILIVGILVTVSVFLGDILRLIPVAALYGMFIYLGLNGLRGLDSINSLSALVTRHKYWGRWEFLANLPQAQLAVITMINFSELFILIVFIILAEFAQAGYVTLATPLVLIGSGLIREFLLPKWQWLYPSLEKLDKRCLPPATTAEHSDTFDSNKKRSTMTSVETLVF